MTITINAAEHDNANEAIQYCDAAGHDVAFSIGGRFFSGRAAELDRIERSGVQPSCWYDRDGQIVCVPGHHG